MSTFSPTSSSGSDLQVAEARRAKYVAFLFRAPYALDAHQLGFATGLREDYTFQNKWKTLDVPVFMLDNDFRNPDLERYLEVLDKHDPSVGVIGDAFDADDAYELAETALKLREARDNFEPIIVPKCAEALDIIPDEIIVGYPVGYSDIHATDFSRPVDWAGRRVHILGGSPPKQWAAIRDLVPGDDPTRVDLGSFGGGASDTRRANIVGLDWNGLHRGALVGEYWHHDAPHWRRADDLTVRATVRRGLQHIRRFWKDRGVWPDLTSADVGDALTPRDYPDMQLCSGCGHDLFEPEEVYEVVEYEDAEVRAFCSSKCRDRLEWFEGLIPLDISREDHSYTHVRRRMDGFNAA